MSDGRWLPQPTPETQHFWDGTREGELRLQRCDDCSHTYFPPRPFCPGCGCRDVAVFAASGRATFCCIAQRAAAQPALLRELVRRGHAV